MSETKSNTPVVITLVTKAANDLSKVETGLQKTMDSLHSMVEIARTGAAEIEFQESQRTLLAADMASELRNAKADLQIQIKENAEVVLSNLMTDRGLTKITDCDLINLQDDLALAKDSNEEAINSAVDKAIKTGTISHNASQSLLQSKHSVECADYKARISALTSEISFVRDELNDIKANVEADRKAKVDIEKNKADAIATATLNARQAVSGK